MKKTVITIILAIVGIAAFAWAVWPGVCGFAWFPGFLIAVFCGIKIYDVKNFGQNTQNNARQ